MKAKSKDPGRELMDQPVKYEPGEREAAARVLRASGASDLLAMLDLEDA